MSGNQDIIMIRDGVTGMMLPVTCEEYVQSWLIMAEQFDQIGMNIRGIVSAKAEASFRYHLIKQTSSSPVEAPVLHRRSSTA